MEDISFVLLFISVPVLAIWIYRLSGYSLTRPSLSMVLFWSLMVFGYFGYILMYFGVTQYSETFLFDKSEVLYIWMLGSIALIGVTLGFCFSGRVLRLCHSQQPEQVTAFEGRPYPLLRGLILALVSLGVLYVYLRKLPSIGLLTLIAEQGDVSVSDLSTARIDAVANFEGTYHRYAFFFQFLLPFICFYFLSVYLENRRKGVLALSILLSLVTAFGLVTSMQKSQIIMFVIGLYLVYLYSSGRKINVKTILLLSSLSLTILGLMVSYYLQVDDLWTVIKMPLNRIFAGQLVPQIFYVQYFPKVMDYLFGQSVPNPMALLPFEPVNYTVLVMHYANPDVVFTNAGASMPTTFWGEIYANFGPVGIPIISVFIGIYVCCVDYYLSRIKMKPRRVALSSWCALHYMGLTTTGFSFLLCDIELFLVILVSFFITTSLSKESISAQSIRAVPL